MRPGGRLFGEEWADKEGRTEGMIGGVDEGMKGRIEERTRGRIWK